MNVYIDVWLKDFLPHGVVVRGNMAQASLVQAIWARAIFAQGVVAQGNSICQCGDVLIFLRAHATERWPNSLQERRRGVRASSRRPRQQILTECFRAAVSSFLETQSFDAKLKISQASMQRVHESL